MALQAFFVAWTVWSKTWACFRKRIVCLLDIFIVAIDSCRLPHFLNTKPRTSGQLAWTYSSWVLGNQRRIFARAVVGVMRVECGDRESNIFKTLVQRWRFLSRRSLARHLVKGLLPYNSFGYRRVALVALVNKEVSQGHQTQQILSRDKVMLLIRIILVKIRTCNLEYD